MFKSTPKKNNIIKRPAFISFLKNDRFSGYKNLSIILAIIWGALAFLTSGFVQVVSILLLIASVGILLYVPSLVKKHDKDQFVIEPQFGIHDVNENMQKRIPWSQVVCFVNTYKIQDKKTNSYESIFYIITTNDYIKLDKTIYTDEQLLEIYNILGPWLNQFNRYVAGENLVTVELRDINSLRQKFSGNYMYLK